MDKFKVYEENGKQYIECLVFPRFVAEVTFGVASDFENIRVLDECFDPNKLAKAMRSAVEFLMKGHQIKKR